MTSALINDFTLPSTDGSFTLSSAAGKYVVLYFYPKDDTPTCTIQGNDFSALLDDFTQAGALVLGVSRDSVTSHEDFRQKFGYRHHLLCDEGGALCEAFQVIKNITMRGKTVRGISRSTFLIDGSRRLVREWRDLKDVSEHAQEVLDAIKTLQRGG